MKAFPCTQNVIYFFSQSTVEVVLLDMSRKYIPCHLKCLLLLFSNTHCAKVPVSAISAVVEGQPEI